MEPSKEEKIVMINNNDILPNRFQPRKNFSEEELLDLTESIKKYGVLEPIIVRPLGDKYELVAGERRYKANVLAGNESIPARIIDLDDAESSEIAIIENLQRKDLSALEEALSYKRAIDLGYATQQQLAEKVGKSQSYIANKIRLLKLSDEVQEALLDNKISERHARSLLRIDSLKKQNEMLNRIINERLTVRRTDEEIDKMNNEINNTNNGEELQTTPLSTIFNNSNDNQTINEDGVFKFGPETSVANEQGQALMNFDLNGNPINESDDSTDDSSQAPQFNMFGGVPEMPNMPQMDVESQMNDQKPFGMFNNPEVGVNPQPVEVEPQVSQPEPFGMFENPVVGLNPQPVEVEPQMSQPEPFGMFNNPEVGINPQPVEVEPQMNVQSEPFSNISEQQPVQEFNMNNSDIPQTPIFNSNQQSETIAEFKKPDPIIVTDYSKQYDPVMPDSQPKAPDIDMKTIINLIRQCSDTIEKCGYKIDTEEYDLENMYQVVFKIDKQ